MEETLNTEVIMNNTATDPRISLENLNTAKEVLEFMIDKYIDIEEQCEGLTAFETTKLNRVRDMISEVEILLDEAE